MKYIITESQLYRVVFKYLDMHRFTKLETNDKIYFGYSEDSEFSEITYDKRYKLCNIDKNLISLISDFFSLDNQESKEVIGRWVEYTLQMPVDQIFLSTKGGITALRIGK